MAAGGTEEYTLSGGVMLKTTDGGDTNVGAISIEIGMATGNADK